MEKHEAMNVALKANILAGQIRSERTGPYIGESTRPTNIMRGAASHSCAFFLEALDRLGYEIRKKEVVPPEVNYMHVTAEQLKNGYVSTEDAGRTRELGRYKVLVQYEDGTALVEQPK